MLAEGHSTSAVLVILKIKADYLSISGSYSEKRTFFSLPIDMCIHLVSPLVAPIIEDRHHTVGVIETLRSPKVRGGKKYKSNYTG